MIGSFQRERGEREGEMLGSGEAERVCVRERYAWLLNERERGGY